MRCSKAMADRADRGYLEACRRRPIVKVNATTDGNTSRLPFVTSTSDERGRSQSQIVDEQLSDSAFGLCLWRSSRRSTRFRQRDHEKGRGCVELLCAVCQLARKSIAVHRALFPAIGDLHSSWLSVEVGM